MQNVRSNQLTRQIGEHLVAAKLGRRGYVASPFAGNVPLFDILAADARGYSIPIQVKAIKKAGIAAKGTGQFSILVGERSAELRLDKFYKPEDNPKLIEDVLHAAQQLNGNA